MVCHEGMIDRKKDIGLVHTAPRRGRIAYFWATHQGAELDILLFKSGQHIGVECKRMDAPTLTPSMRIALADLKLDRLLVAYPGERRYSLGDRVEVIPLLEFVGGGADPAQIFKKKRRRGGKDISV
jgi:hypothetical protein